MFNFFIWAIVNQYRKTRGYIAYNGKPLKCLKCKSTNLIEYDKAYVIIGTCKWVDTYKIKCKCCNKYLAKSDGGIWIHA